MVYKRYIKKNGKIYGPYIYHSRKVEGKVISEYRGKGSANKKNFSFPLIILMLIAFLSLIFILNNNCNFSSCNFDSNNIYNKKKETRDFSKIKLKRKNRNNFK